MPTESDSGRGADLLARDTSIRCLIVTQRQNTVAGPVSVRCVRSLKTCECLGNISFTEFETLEVSMGHNDPSAGVFEVAPLSEKLIKLRKPPAGMVQPSAAVIDDLRNLLAKGLSREWAQLTEQKREKLRHFWGDDSFHPIQLAGDPKTRLPRWEEIPWVHVSTLIGHLGLRATVFRSQVDADRTVRLTDARCESLKSALAWLCAYHVAK